MESACPNMFGFIYVSGFRTVKQIQGKVKKMGQNGTEFRTQTHEIKQKLQNYDDCWQVGWGQTGNLNGRRKTYHKYYCNNMSYSAYTAYSENLKYEGSKICTQKSCTEGCCNKYGYCPSTTTVSGVSVSQYSNYFTGWSDCTYYYTNIGAIVGGVIGGVVGLILIILLIILIKKKCYDNQPSQPPQPYNPNPNVTYVQQPVNYGQPQR